MHVYITVYVFEFITSERIERVSYYQPYVGRFDDIQTSLKPFKKMVKIYINLYAYFKTTWNI